MTTYVEFEEYNDYEGAHWSFFIPVEGNEEELDKFNSTLESIKETVLDEFMGEEIYKLKLGRKLSEEEVDVLIEFSDVGYCNRFNKLEGTFIVPNYSKLRDEWLEEYDGELLVEHIPSLEEVIIEDLYKGGVERFMH